jgi:hypothetical protein
VVKRREVEGKKSAEEKKEGNRLETRTTPITQGGTAASTSKATVSAQPKKQVVEANVNVSKFFPSLNRKS